MCILTKSCSVFIWIALNLNVKYFIKLMKSDQIGNMLMQTMCCYWPPLVLCLWISFVTRGISTLNIVHDNLTKWTVLSLFNMMSCSLHLTFSRQNVFLLRFSISGNYYGTPRPIHVSTESPPITYQEHRNLLRNFRTRSKSLSNLEKTAEDENSEDDSGLSGKCH